VEWKFESFLAVSAFGGCKAAEDSPVESSNVDNQKVLYNYIANHFDLLIVRGDFIE
jgi:hypothetical protein